MSEVQKFQENLQLEKKSPEQLEKIKIELKQKIDTFKQDGSFSSEELSSLVDLLSDKTILSPTEKELKSHLEWMKKLERQIDFLVALSELKPYQNENLTEQATIYENAIEEKANWRDKLKAIFRAEWKILEIKWNENDQIRYLKELWGKLLREWKKENLNSIENIIDIIKIFEKIEKYNTPENSKKIDFLNKKIDAIIGKGSVHDKDRDQIKTIFENIKNTDKLTSKLEVNENDTENIKDLKKLYNDIWGDISKTDKEKIIQQNHIQNMVEQLNEIDELVKKSPEKSKDEYIKNKLGNIDNIIKEILKRPEKDPRESDTNWIKLERYDIEYELLWSSEAKIWKDLYEKNIDDIKTTAEAQALLEYTNRNFKELDGKWVRSWENTLAWLDNETEILNFQKKLIEKIRNATDEWKIKEWYTYWVKYEPNKWYIWEVIQYWKNSDIKNQTEKNNEQLLWKNLDEEKTSKFIDWLSSYESSRKGDLLKWDIKELNGTDLITALKNLKASEIDAKVMKNLENISKNEAINVFIINDLDAIKKILENKNIEIDLVKLTWADINKDSIQKWIIWDIIERFISEKTYENENQSWFIKNVLQKWFTHMGINNILNIDPKLKKIYETANQKVKANFDEIIEKENWRIESSEEAIKKIKEITAWVDKNSELLKEWWSTYEKLKKELSYISAEVAYNPDFMTALVKAVDFTKAWRRITDFYNLWNNLSWSLKLVNILIKENWKTEKDLANNVLMNYSEYEKFKLLIYKNIDVYKDEKSDLSKDEKILFQKILNSFNEDVTWVEEAATVSRELKEKETNTWKVVEELKNKENKETNNNVENFRKDIAKLKNLFPEWEVTNEKIEILVNLLEETNEENLNSVPLKILFFKENWKLPNENELNSLKENLETKRKLLKIKEDLSRFNWIIERLNSQKAKEADKKATELVGSQEKKNELDNKINEEVNKALEERLAEKRKKEWKNEFLTPVEEKIIRNQVIENIVNEDNGISTEKKAELIKQLKQKYSNENLSKQAEHAKNNNEEYINFVTSKDADRLSFSDYAIKNKIELKNEKWEVINREAILKNEALNNKILKLQNWTEINKETWIFKLQNWVTWRFSKEEQNLIEQNPKLQENIIKTFEIFNRLWLTKLWDLRGNIIKSLQNKFPTLRIEDWDYLNEHETKMMLNAILVSVWEKPVNQNIQLNAFLEEIENKNWRQSIWGKETEVNSYWDTSLEKKFIEKFIPRTWDMLWFKQSAFEDSLK